jgi:hypothetical protein
MCFYFWLVPGYLNTGSPTVVRDGGAEHDVDSAMKKFRRVALLAEFHGSLIQDLRAPMKL